MMVRIKSVRGSLVTKLEAISPIDLARSLRMDSMIVANEYPIAERWDNLHNS